MMIERIHLIFTNKLDYISYKRLFPVLPVKDMPWDSGCQMKFHTYKRTTCEMVDIDG